MNMLSKLKTYSTNAGHQEEWKRPCIHTILFSDVEGVRYSVYKIIMHLNIVYHV